MDKKWECNSIWELNNHEGKIRVKDIYGKEYIGTFNHIYEADEDDFCRPGNILYLDCSREDIYGIFEDTIVEIELL